jgi:hypothetical protein
MKMNSILRSGAIIAAVLGGVAPASAATSINTVSPFLGNFTPIGIPNTSTYGQTFTVGADNVLNGFSMYLAGQATFDFKAYVYAWDGAKATGPALFGSALHTFTGSPASTPTEFAYDTGNLALTNGQQYVAFLSTAGLQGAQPDSTGGMPYSDSNPYSGGDFVYYNSGNNFSLLTTSSWELTGGSGDAWFKAQFNDGAGAVPEPATWAMMIAGFAMVGGTMRYRRRKTSISFA